MRRPSARVARAPGSSSWMCVTCLAACSLAATVLGCAHTSVLERIPDIAEPPAAFDRGPDPATGAAAPGACGDLGDRTLRDLQDRLAGQSFDLQAAWRRFEAAGARARESGAYLMPRVDASLTGQRPHVFRAAASSTSSCSRARPGIRAWRQVSRSTSGAGCGTGSSRRCSTPRRAGRTCARWRSACPRCWRKRGSASSRSGS